MCYFFPGRGGRLEKAVLCFVVPPHSTPPFFSACFAFFGVRFLHTGWLQWQEDQSGGSSG